MVRKRTSKQSKNTGCLGAIFGLIGALIKALVAIIAGLFQLLVSIAKWLNQQKVTLPTRGGYQVSGLFIVLLLCFLYICGSMTYAWTNMQLHAIGILPTYTPTPSPAPTATNTPTPTATNLPTPTQTPTLGPTPTSTLVPTPTPSYYHIPSELLGQEFVLLESDWYSGLPEEVQAQVGETVFTNIDGVRLEITLQDVSHSIKDDAWRAFVTTFEFYNPSDDVITIASEEFFDAWGNFGNWRGAIVVLGTKANFEIRPDLTVIDIHWTTRKKNFTVWVTINCQTGTQSVVLDENSAIYRIEFPPVPTQTPTPTRTPVN
jgi:hypothetical protein